MRKKRNNVLHRSLKTGVSFQNETKRILACFMCFGVNCALAFLSSGSTFRHPQSTCRPGTCLRRQSGNFALRGLAAVTKTEFIELCKSGPKNGVGCSEELAQRVKAGSESLVSPTKRIASSSIVNGTWRLIFTTTTGSSGGKLGPFVGEVDQDIKYDDGKYYNILRLGPVEAVLSAHWDVVGENKWDVTFDDIKLSLFGFTLIDKEFGSGRDQTLETLDSVAGGDERARSSTNGGSWDLKYADESLRVLYAYGTGKDPTRANIFVLEKVC